MPPKRKSTASAAREPAVTRRTTRQRSGEGPKAAHASPRPPPTQTPVPIPTPLTWRRPRPEGDVVGAAVGDNKNARPSNLIAPEITYHVPQPQQPGRAPSSLVRPHGPSAPPPRPLSMPAASLHHHHHHNCVPPRPDRNIDKVVLGNLCFRTWYPSQYGKEMLGDSSGNAKSGGGRDGAKEQPGGKPSSKDQPMLERLYVCPSCFKYAKELVAWQGHVRLCERRAHMPGSKIYVHPQGRRTVLIAHDGKAPGTKRRRGDGAARYVEVIEDQGEWSIWEVDGEEDGLFCQNLSLFAKLFLDNKSVFFDVTGFNYYLLVYTPPVPRTCEPEARPPPPPQITGFFSKEKMSWDNNNLACILVFPPWQCKGLGGLLMGASYEMSRREGILGGPEKPISDLGKKGYKRFWSGAVARWLLGLEAGETIVDVNDVSRGTWISPDDCLGVLRDMGVVEDAGIGPGNPEAAEAEGLYTETSAAAATDSGAPIAAPATGDEDGLQEQDAARVVRQVPRVRLDKKAVRRFVAAHAISLEPTCDARGFVDGYAVKAARPEEGRGGGEGGEGGET